ncbi:hypothetical protein D3C73_1595610 [compost metagenome]
MFGEMALQRTRAQAHEVGDMVDGHPSAGQEAAQQALDMAGQLFVVHLADTVQMLLNQPVQGRVGIVQ